MDKGNRTTGEQLPDVTSLWQLLAFYVKQHGAMMFGVIVVVTLWITMFVPELDRSALDLEAQKELLYEMKSLNAEMTRRADKLEATIQILDRAVERIIKFDANK